MAFCLFFRFSPRGVVAPQTASVISVLLYYLHQNEYGYKHSHHLLSALAFLSLLSHLVPLWSVPSFPLGLAFWLRSVSLPELSLMLLRHYRSDWPPCSRLHRWHRNPRRLGSN